MNARTSARLALDPSVILEAQGIRPDPWQRSFLLCEDRSIMLLCCRGAGKSRATSAKALHRALIIPKSLVLVISRSQRQSGELFRYVLDGYRALDRPVKAIRETMTELELANGSRVVCLPSKEETIRSYQGVSLLIKDEGARIPDDLNKSVTPMLAVSQGQEIDLSTPWGMRGWFFRKWRDEELKIRRFKVTWKECPRHTTAFIENERRQHGDAWVGQEYDCLFTALTGLVYPRFAEQAGWDMALFPTAKARRPGGIDFGFRNPFAALWGHVTPAGILEITNELYVRETPIHVIAGHLPKNVEWYADPAHPTEIRALRYAGFTVRKANNQIAAGIAAVRARLESKTLRIARNGCPNLFDEAELYRYPSADEQRSGLKAEIPIDADNHAMAALRYLISRIDSAFIAKWLKGRPVADLPAQETDIDPTIETVESLTTAKVLERNWLDPRNPELWTSLN